MFEEAPPHIRGLVELVRTTGAYSMQVRSFDDGDIWMVLVKHVLDDEGMPTYEGTLDGEWRMEVTAAGTLGEAMVRMIQALFDGGECLNCHRPIMFHPSTDGKPPFTDLVCQTYWNQDTMSYEVSCGVN